MIFCSIALEKSEILLLMISAGIAGITGTGLGGLFGLFFGKSTNKVVSCVLSVAAGVMIAVVCFDLIPQAEKLSDYKTYVSLLGVVVGVVMIFALSKLFTKHEGAKKERSYAEDNALHNKKRLIQTGVVMVLAISLHNFPEGMAIGSTGWTKGGFEKSILIASLLALHNIPEGMAISIPLITGGMKPHKTIFLTIVAGAVTVLGAFVGLLVGAISPFATAFSLALAGGAMLYITFAEILPEAMEMYKGKITAIFLISGLLIGLFVIQVGGF